ncbi:MAG: PLD nuclease N-terminal domain-containing protein [Acidimicrobiia bacterium]
MSLFDETVNVAIVIAIVVPLLLLWVAAFYDLLRRKDLSVVRKALWTALIVFTAYVGIAIYFIARPIRPPEGKRYGKTAPRARGVVDDIERARTEYASGSIDDETYLTKKRMLLGLQP